MIKLMDLLTEDVYQESQAADDAKQQGLEYMKFGRWGKDGKVTHHTVNGKLTPTSTATSPTTKKSDTKPSLAQDKFQKVMAARVQQAMADKQARDAEKPSTPSVQSDPGGQYQVHITEKPLDPFHNPKTTLLGTFNTPEKAQAALDQKLNGPGGEFFTGTIKRTAS